MAEKLKIGYFADGPWSHRAFDLLIIDKLIEISFIVPRSDTTDCTLYNLSKKYEIPYHKGIKINSIEFFELAKSYNCDLFVSMSFNQIFKPKITDLPRLGTINCHAGKLPFYRGRNILNWVLINDEKEFGITVHFIDEGIDTGDIILQRVFSITDNDSYSTLLEQAYSECAKILYDAVKLIYTGSYERTQQCKLHPIGFYCGLRGIGDEIINWTQTSRQIFNFIRSISKPGPRGITFIDGKPVFINKARMIDKAPEYTNTIGQIVGKTTDGFIVKTIDTTIEILEIESEIKLKVGDRFGS
jgi:methionyl-tRNA formyltransferase